MARSVSFFIVMSQETAELMREFVRTKSSSAFAALVKRYLPVVYGAALRRSGDRSLAEDVSQLVFAEFARRMPTLRADERIGSWLHRASVLRAADLLKSERRRRRREQRAAAMMELDRLTNDDATRNLLPIVDEALSGLRRADRDAIVLRFYEGCSLRKVGEALGVSEDAAQKRLERALEKLRKQLRRVGIGTSVSLLTLFLGERVAAASVPSSLASKVVAGIDLTQVATSSWWMTQGSILRLASAGALVTLLISIVPISSQWQRVKDLRLEALSPRESKVTSRATRIPRERKSVSTRSLGKALSVPEIVNLLGEIFAGPPSSLDLVLVKDLLSRIADAEAGQALLLMDSWSAAMLQRMDAAISFGEARRNLCLRWSRNDPQAALAWALAQLKPGSPSYRERFFWIRGVGNPLKEWAKRDWNAAWAWVQAGIEDESLLLSDRKLDVPHEIAQTLEEEITKRMGLRGAIDFATTLQQRAGPSMDGNALNTFISRIKNDEDAIYFLNAVEQISSPKNRVRLRGNMLSQWGKFNWEGAASWVRSRPTAIEQVVAGWELGFPPSDVNHDRTAYANYLHELMPLRNGKPNFGLQVLRDLQYRAYSQVSRNWLLDEPAAATDWLIETGLRYHNDVKGILRTVTSSPGSRANRTHWETNTARLLSVWKEQDEEKFRAVVNDALDSSRGEPEAIAALESFLERIP